MKQCVRLAMIAALATGLVGTLATPVLAGDATPKLRVAKHADGPYREIVGKSLSPGAKHVFHFKAKSTNGEKSDASFSENQGLGNEYTVKYFRKDQNITEAVTTDVYEFTLTPKVKRFKVIVKGVSGLLPPECIVNEAQSTGGESLTGIAVNGGNCN